MESWRQVWRGGLAPSITDAGLAALRAGLEADDHRLVQGATTTPPPLMCVRDWPVEAACALGFCAWQGDGVETVGDVELFFVKCCYDADTRLGEPAACRWFLNWFDDTPRDSMRRDLMAEVDYELSRRAEVVAA